MFKRFKISDSDTFLCIPKCYVWFIAGSHTRVLEIDIFGKRIEIPYIWFGVPCKIIR